MYECLEIWSGRRNIVSVSPAETVLFRAGWLVLIHRYGFTDVVVAFLLLYIFNPPSQKQRQKI